MDRSLYFVGIGGVGMTSVAGLAKAAGFDVKGSDQNLYPPTSLILEELKIPVFVPYSEDNIRKNKDCLFVIGNSLSRQHPEVAKILELGAEYTSFPKLLSDYFLSRTNNIVVCGTHGKTTTSSLLAYVLQNLGSKPSYMIGGAPHDLPHAFQWDLGKFFVLEGDEYDTAFFDKGSKFLHYRPTFIVLNNLEFDHADIFKDFSMVKKTFHLLLDQISDPENLIANTMDAGVRELVSERGWSEKTFATAEARNIRYDSASQLWHGEFQTPFWGILPIVTRLPGAYNFSNIGQVLATLSRLVKSDKMPLPEAAKVQELISNFHGVARRWDHLASVHEIEIYVDFAHHPTAVNNVLKNLRTVYPTRKIVAAFEPKNASSRRNVFQKQYGEVLKQADRVLIAPAPVDKRLSEEERLNTKALSMSIGKHASPFDSYDELQACLKHELHPSDVLIFLSCGDFAGLPRALVEHFRQAV